MAKECWQSVCLKASSLNSLHSFSFQHSSKLTLRLQLPIVGLLVPLMTSLRADISFKILDKDTGAYIKPKDESWILRPTTTEQRCEVQKECTCVRTHAPCDNNCNPKQMNPDGGATFELYRRHQSNDEAEGEREWALCIWSDMSDCVTQLLSIASDGQTAWEKAHNE